MDRMDWTGLSGIAITCSLVGAYTIAGLDWWTGSVDWTGLDWTAQFL